MGRRVRLRRVFALLLSLVFLGCVARTAAAQPATANVIQLGGGAQYGLNLKDTEPNPWGFGLGLGVGYTLPMALYTGAQFEYFFGGKADVPGGELEANLWDLFAEVGYDFAIGEGVVLRGKGDLGIASLSAEACLTDVDGETACASDSEADVLIGPGAAFIYLGKSFSLSLNVRYDIVLADPNLQGLVFSVGVGF